MKPGPWLALLAALPLAGCGSSSGATRAKPAPEPVSVALAAGVESAVPGQEVFGTWSVSPRPSAVTGCTLGWAPAGGVPVEGPVAASGSNAFMFGMPDAESVTAWLRCRHAGGTAEAMVEVSRVRSADLAAQGPPCWPAPDGTGSPLYTQNFTNERNRPSVCGVWFCGDDPWPVCGERGLIDFPGLPATYGAQPWKTLGAVERGIVDRLVERNRP